MDRRSLAFAFAFAYVVLVLGVLMVLGYMFSWFYYGFDMEPFNNVVMALWVAGIAVLFIMFLLRYSSSKPEN